MGDILLMTSAKSRCTSDGGGETSSSSSISVCAAAGGRAAAGMLTIARRYSAPYLCCSLANSSAATRIRLADLLRQIIERKQRLDHLLSTSVERSRRHNPSPRARGCTPNRGTPWHARVVCPQRPPRAGVGSMTRAC